MSKPVSVDDVIFQTGGYHFGSALFESSKLDPSTISDKGYYVGSKVSEDQGQTGENQKERSHEGQGERSHEGQGESLTWSTFCNDTTVHGVRFIFRETHVLRR